jgi:serine/threonine-protein kinase RsbW
MAATSEDRRRSGGAPGAPPSLVPGLRWRRVLPGEERQLTVLRRWIATLLPPCPARDDVTTVANELCSNAIKHTASGRGGWFAVEITWHGPVVTVAVADNGAPAGPQVISDLDREHGRGLLLVQGLSVRTGVRGDRRGRLTWADVHWDSGTSQAPAPADSYEDSIRAGEQALARRFDGVPAWFGRSTLAWWAVGPGGLLTAASAQGLAAMLYRLLDACPDRCGRPAQLRTGSQKR